MKKEMKKGLLCAVLVVMTAAVFAQSGTSGADQDIAKHNEAMEYYNRGNAYHDKGEYDKAIADFTQALRIIPNFAVAYYNRGLAYSDKGEYDKAIADNNQALRINPNYALAYLNRGTAYANKGDYARARTDWEKALQLDPNDAIARNNLEILRGWGY